MTTHGHTKGRGQTPEYRAWQSMISRCTIPSASHFAEYGGRSITVCLEWRSFEPFFAALGPRPSPKHSLDRIDVDGHYEPGNVRWATSHDQHRNMRSNHYLTIDGERLILVDWARRVGLSDTTIIHRLQAGWSEHDAVFTPNLNRQRAGRRPPSYKPWDCVQCGARVTGQKRANTRTCPPCREKRAA